MSFSAGTFPHLFSQTAAIHKILHVSKLPSTLRLPYSHSMHRHIIRINLTRLHVFQQLLHEFALKARIGKHRDQRVGSGSQNIGRQHQRFSFPPVSFCSFPLNEKNVKRTEVHWTHFCLFHDRFLYKHLHKADYEYQHPPVIGWQLLNNLDHLSIIL